MYDCMCGSINFRAGYRCENTCAEYDKTKFTRLANNYSCLYNIRMNLVFGYILPRTEQLESAIYMAMDNIYAAWNEMNHLKQT